MVFVSYLTHLLGALLKLPSQKMYEFATDRWLFNPEATGDISGDVVHLAQMTQRTGQDHEDAELEQYGIREKLHDPKGKETPYSISLYSPSFLGMLRRATVGGTSLASIESELNESTIHSNGGEEVAAFIRVMWSFLALDPAQRPRAAEALLDPAFEHAS